MAIDRKDARPLNLQITEDLQRRITADEFPVGSQFPSLRALASEYEVAELTVHAAVKHLQSEGVLVSTTGRGTFVRAKPSHNSGNSAESADLGEIRDQLADLRNRIEALERDRWDH